MLNFTRNTFLKKLKKHQKSEGGFTIIEAVLATILTCLIGTMAFTVIVPSNKMMNDMITDKDAAKPTVILAKQIRQTAMNLYEADPNKNHAPNAVLNTSDFATDIPKLVEIPETFQYYICKTTRSRMFIAAYDTSRTADEGFSRSNPYVYDGTGLDIRGIDQASCGRYDKTTKAFIWEPITDTSPQ